MSIAVVKKDRSRRGQRKNSNKAQVSRFAGDAYSLAERAVKGVKFLSKLINIETKYLDYTLTSGLTTTPTVTYASALAQGLDISNRVGDSIRLQGLHYSFAVGGSLLFTGPNWVRILIVRDLENPGATPAWLDVLAAVSATAQPNYLNRNRFNILFDESFYIVRETGPMADIRKGSIAMNGHVKYRLTTAAAGAAAEGSLYFMGASSLAANSPTLDAVIRILYTDD